MLRGIPIVFVMVDDAATRQSIEQSVRHRGLRLEFLPACLDGERLAGAVEEALERAGGENPEVAGLRGRFASLTRRQREVMGLIVCGLLNKQVGAELGTSEITVKAHRRNAMRKMQAGSFAELVRMAAKLGIPADAHALPYGSAPGQVTPHAQPVRQQPDSPKNHARDEYDRMNAETLSHLSRGGVLHHSLPTR
jgi:DNA-binding CsgD family transcriptional regulator